VRQKPYITWKLFNLGLVLHHIQFTYKWRNGMPPVGRVPAYVNSKPRLAGSCFPSLPKWRQAELKSWIQAFTTACLLLQEQRLVVDALWQQLLLHDAGARQGVTYETWRFK